VTSPWTMAMLAVCVKVAIGATSCSRREDIGAPRGCEGVLCIAIGVTPIGYDSTSRWGTSERIDM
jgi:hypothetical protein